MRTKVMTVVLVFVFVSVASGSPRILTYQGSLLRPGGGAVGDGSYDMRFSIYDVTSGGASLWTETDAGVQLTGGLFSTILGDGTAFSSMFFPWHYDLWLEVEVDVDRSSTFDPDEVFAPRQRLTAAPWAMDADRLNGRDSSAFWHTTGNASTTSGTHFLGTTDNAPLDLRVNNSRALQLEPTTGTANLIGGYSGNSVAPGVVGATIGGGGAGGNINRVGGNYGTVGGGYLNTASGTGAVIGGGTGNTASGNYATVGAGYWNTASEEAATVGGGLSNNASVSRATVGGGGWNNANGDFATVGGGGGNAASGEYATVGGGDVNTASGSCATVAGGDMNFASGNCATIPGGDANLATTYSLAAGRRAKATHEGSFVWGDSTDANFASQRNNQFRARANGGVRFDVNNSEWVDIRDDGTNLINTSAGSPGARLTIGGTWTGASDRNHKENVVRADGREVLEKLASIPISTWNYDVEDPSIRHMGPMAQDLYAAFGLGDSDKSITTIDGDGVALAAIQGLYQIVQEREARIADLEVRLAALESAVPRTAKSALQTSE